MKGRHSQPSACDPISSAQPDCHLEGRDKYDLWNRGERRGTRSVLWIKTVLFKEKRKSWFVVSPNDSDVKAPTLGIFELQVVE